MKKIILLLILSSTFAINDADAQRFKGSAVFGLNLCQIDGDEIAGFSKLGLTGGFKLAYPLQDNIDLNIEMLYSQRGSTTGFGFGSMGENYTDLQFISLPVYFNIKDWFMEEEDYHKVKAHGGLSYGYLFAVDSSNGALSNDINTYNRHNISYLLGVDYAFNSKLGLTVRYTRAFNSLVDVRAISYFVTVRTDYTF
ncbi:MAG: porin family protein [Saprospiraceae bacterium]|nr:porin family protein [Saprospiraceae bacterium]